MDECIHVLSSAPECYSDSIFIAQVRLQMIEEKIANHTASTKTGAGETGDSKVAIPFYIHALNVELDEVRRGLSTDNEKNGK